eukprot:m.221324 g.221324  ORF g.221324 m.221324 type:complete len:75 (-) comp19186_c0_seq4:160-384(-)
MRVVAGTGCANVCEHVCYRRSTVDKDVELGGAHGVSDTAAADARFVDQHCKYTVHLPTQGKATSSIIICSAPSF